MHVGGLSHKTALFFKNVPGVIDNTRYRATPKKEKNRA